MISVNIPLELLSDDTPLTVAGLKAALGAENAEYSRDLEQKVILLSQLIAALGDRLEAILDNSENQFEKAKALREFVAHLREFKGPETESENGS